ncbi:hypothetical protein B1A_10275 [mine drainage metagenome]|uniref:Uncharacterized protein n=1 Tax=mine drainage metagenome TaxID=410659 RepID=T1ARU0_9ZZZZ
MPLVTGGGPASVAHLQKSQQPLGNVKNALYSTCHALKKYLQRYLHEFCYDQR